MITLILFAVLIGWLLLDHMVAMRDLKALRNQYAVEEDQQVHLPNGV